MPLKDLSLSFMTFPQRFADRDRLSRARRPDRQSVQLARAGAAAIQGHGMAPAHRVCRRQPSA